MHAISVPCHACGHDNPADAFHCAQCQTAIRLNLQPTTTTQHLAPASSGDTKEEELIREAYFEVSLLLQSVHRLKALIDKRR